MEIAAILVSIVAIIISIVVAIIQYNTAIGINKMNLKSVYFNEIYMKYLIYEIPNARKYIHITFEGKLTGDDKIRNELNKMRQDSLYYLYNDELFYNKLKHRCQILEDYIIESSTKKMLGEDQTEFNNKLKEELKAIYKIINDKFLHTN
ncbi:hypothetical protein [Paenibacillus sp. L3-i20]|uniref:hypothetical protein n=1 Tax=Paenibacillus sp. L3-i20 TaxID=2905833 RepID=UPI001EE00F80|nr:hypothetical protein [Paenibacillus sp. L3-i20]GKU78001.1 hypothetical protein L3i20_v223980 [Paenibacillus sp. L3-i20]